MATFKLNDIAVLTSIKIETPKRASMGLMLYYTIIERYCRTL